MIHSLVHLVSPSLAGRPKAVAVAFAVCAVVSPSAAQTLDEMKEAMRIMAGSAAVCSDYLKRPEVLEEVRQTGRYQLGQVGMSEAEADAFMDAAQAEARAEDMTETHRQIACEIINIQALE